MAVKEEVRCDSETEALQETEGGAGWSNKVGVVVCEAQDCQQVAWLVAGCRSPLALRCSAEQVWC